MKLLKYSVLVLSLLGSAGMARAQTIPNPSFETDSFTILPGYAASNGGSISGWTTSNTGRVGLNPAAGGSQFADNGAVPDGTNVAFIQAGVNTTNSLSTAITGLTPGTVYRVSFRANHSSASQAGTQDWSLNGGAFMPFTAYPAVGGSNPYYTNSALFMATNTTAALVLRNGANMNGVATVVLDNFTIAATLQVTNAADAGPGSLRQVVADATTGATITFATNLAGQTITLTSGRIILTNNVVIDASTVAGGISLDGNHASRVFQVNNGITATLNSLTITNGNAEDDDYSGGGIWNQGTLTLSQCTLTGNAASNYGGAIENDHTLTLNNCTLTGNSSGSGGGIRNQGTLTLSQCTLTGNATSSYGGAIENYNTLTLNNCTLTGNSGGAGGGIWNWGPLTLNNCTLAGNVSTYAGGAIFNYINSTLMLNNCTLTGNSGGDSGAIYNYNSTLTLNNCTLTGNSAVNLGGAIDVAAGANATLTACILAGNTTDSGSGPDLWLENGSTLTATNCLISNGKDSTITNANGNLVGSSAAPIDAQLAPLGNYGGPTQTMPPLAGSPAIDAGGTSTLTTDQRGLPRPVDGDGNGSAIADIGAVEYQLVVVQNVNDSGDGSLRAAVSASDGRVIFAPLLAGQTITLTSGPIILTNSVIIDARTLAGGISVDGNHASRVFQVNSNITATLNSLTITNGNAEDNGGGGIRNQGTLTLSQCTLTGNAAYFGGAIENDATLTLNNCTLTGNSGEYGGGAIYNNYGSLTLTNCTLTGNTSPYDGGAIYNDGPLTLNNCTLTGNSGRYGGGIYNDDGTLTLNNCTLIGNGADYGGAIDNEVTLTLNNCTLTGNSSGSGGGGAIFNDRTLTLNNCTLANNNCSGGGAFSGGGAIDVATSARATLTACVLAGNTANSGTGPDLWLEARGTLTATNCLISKGTNSMITNNVNGNLVGTAALPLAARLAPLSNYGGPTQTMPPLAGSPAIDAGGTTTLTTDQRGFLRVVGSAVDIGAVELQANETYSLAVGSPVLAQVLISAVNHTFQFSFTNTTGGSYRVLTSTNLALPLVNWSPVGTVTESPAGQYHFTQTGVTNAAQFYRVVSP